MSSFAKTWQETVPAGSDSAFDLDTFIKDLKIGANERSELEHISWDDATSGADDPTNAAAQGRHKPGLCSVTYVGTWTQISALSGMKSGATAWDTTNGVLRIYNGTDWTTCVMSGVPLSGIELLVSIFGSAALAAAAATIVGSWTTPPTTIANIFDKSAATNWGDAIATASTSIGYYWDLAAVYQGYLFILGTHSTNSSLSGSLTMAYADATVRSGAASFSASLASSKEFVAIMPFFGRYVGMYWSNGQGTSTISVQRFEAYGKLV